MKTIQIRCTGSRTLPIEALEEMQGGLKDLSKENYEKLKKEILDTGFAFPVYVWKSKDGRERIVGGHQRHRVLKTLQTLGYEIPPVPVIDIEANDEQEAKRRILQDASSYGTVNSDGLEEFLHNANFSLEFAADSFRLPDVNLDRLFEGSAEFGTQGLTDPDDIPEVKETRAKLGDIWVLGNHRLMCGDSTSADAVEKLMNGESADLVFTDPPYRMEVEGGSNQMVGKAARKLGEAIKHLCDFDPQLFLNAIPTVFKSGVMNAYIFCNKDLVPDYLFWAIEAGFSFNILFWKKPNAIPLGGSHRPDVEYLLLFRKSGTWNNGLQDVSYSKCLEFGRETRKDHPTVKPVDLIYNEVQISSKPGGNVVDFFGGSGSTLIACEKASRKCLMMELDPKYCSVIIARWEAFTGESAKLVSG
jgi:DNA modification methylase